MGSKGDAVTTTHYLADNCDHPHAAWAEMVDVRYRGSVDLKPFICIDTNSTFVNRVCYDKKETYMLILLNKTWYHYCEIPDRVVQALRSAESKGRYFNANIKGTGNDGPYDCRTLRIPKY